MDAIKETFECTGEQVTCGKPYTWLEIICPLVEAMLSILGTACYACSSTLV
jgi:hypothetical protein